MYEMSRNWRTPERRCPQVKQESTAHHIGMISSNGYLRGLKLHAMVAFKPLIFSRNLMRVAGYKISFLTDIIGEPSPPLHLDRLSVRRGGLRGGLLSSRALGQSGELPRPEEPEPAQRTESERTRRRRAERLLNEQRVTFLAGPVGEGSH